MVCQHWLVVVTEICFLILKRMAVVEKEEDGDESSHKRENFPCYLFRREDGAVGSPLP